MYRSHLRLSYLASRPRGNRLSLPDPQEATKLLLTYETGLGKRLRAEGWIRPAKKWDWIRPGNVSKKDPFRGLPTCTRNSCIFANS